MKPIISPESPKQSRMPTQSGMYRMNIKKKWTETRIVKMVFFNRDRWHFYVASFSDDIQKFHGAENNLEIVWVLNSDWKIVFPNNPEYFVAETIHVSNSVESLSHERRTALRVALSAQKPIWFAASTVPDYLRREEEQSI